jgi:hypothetical protein
MHLHENIDSVGDREEELNGTVIFIRLLQCLSQRTSIPLKERED